MTSSSGRSPHPAEEAPAQTGLPPAAAPVSPDSSKPVLRVKFTGFRPGFESCDFQLVPMLRRHFTLVESEQPDFLFCSVFCDPSDWLRHDCVRIFFSGENWSPDFTLFDYAIGYDRLSCGDRYLRYTQDIINDYARSLAGRTAPTAQSWAARSRFCNFIFSHPSENGMRERLASLLEQYRHVDCAGTLNNNMPDGFVASDYTKKLDFVRQCRFTICCESTSLDGFVTEKLTHAFAGGSIPIYYGDPGIAQDYNTDAFVLVQGPDGAAAAAERVQWLDAHPEACLEMLSRPVWTGGIDRKALCDGQLEDFLVHICSQQPARALRRSRCFQARRWEDWVRDAGAALRAETAPAPSFAERARDRLKRTLKL